jgi:enoyl-[acyl-carrier-protein] reductase (NADH)
MGVDDFDHQLHDDIEDLVAEGLLDQESDGYGIAQQMIHRGAISLSEAQRAVFERDVSPALEKLYRMRETNRIQMSNPD